MPDPKPADLHKAIVAVDNRLKLVEAKLKTIEADAHGSNKDWLRVTNELRDMIYANKKAAGSSVDYFDEEIKKLKAAQ